MPFAFAIIGLTFIVAGVRGTSADLIALIEGDFTGQNNFVYWVLAILILGSLGYIDTLRPLSRAMLILVLLVLVLSEAKKTSGGVFAKFQQAINEITDSEAA